MLGPILQWVNKIYQNTNSLLTDVSAIPTSPINSIQRGVTAMPGEGATTNVTINSVNLSKSFVSMSASVYVNTGSALRRGVVFAHLTSSTNLRIENQGESANDIGGSVAWEVIEFA